MGDDTAKKCIYPSPIRFLFIATIENTALCHTLAVIILCQELSSLLQNHETTIYLYHIAVVVFVLVIVTLAKVTIFEDKLAVLLRI